MSVQFLMELTRISTHSQPRGVGKVQQGEQLIKTLSSFL
ncbi:hypothetical protein MICAE_790009 [Microcystis aeruginosa PCC 9806]|uniref:Uncharacterized protein n=3 Tax=Microcystis TaxID=1125 RepID=I4FW09_MICAE|nr:hypothetical protein VL20_5010 [Microcystis panniformis FACHB-1757]CCH99834.1 hypothetical protein MICAB_6830003 [Microcystis aeruginosa PCC 9717]CCI16222.1 hypothetical protein MICAE_790009 [Microcystis aeruginosa PCC 9806]CCI34137.1 hypothetical protein MICAI_640015 [Microcystis sp. T1-4]